MQSQSDPGHERLGSPRSEAEAESEVAPGPEVIDLTQPSTDVESSSAQAIINASLGITAPTSQPGSHPPVIASSSQPQRQHRNPAQIPTADDLEIVDGFGHVRIPLPQSQPAQASLPARGGSNTSLDRSNMYRMPGTGHVRDTRLHQPALLEPINPTHLHQPWQPVPPGEDIGGGTVHGEQGVGDDMEQEHQQERTTPPASESGASRRPPAGSLDQVGDRTGPPQHPMQDHSENSGRSVQHEPDPNDMYDPLTGTGYWEAGHIPGLQVPPPRPMPSQTLRSEPLQPPRSEPLQALRSEPLQPPESGNLRRGDDLPRSLNSSPNISGAGPVPSVVSGFDPASPAHSQQPTVFTPGRQNMGPPPRPVRPTQPAQTGVGGQSTNDQFQARNRELPHLIATEIQTHHRVLDALIAGHPEWQNQPPDARFQQRETIWTRQFETFEREFRRRHNTDPNALFVMAESSGFDNRPISRQRQLIEVQTRINNGLPEGQLPLDREVRLTRSVLEAQLDTLQAWTRFWRDRLPERHRERVSPEEFERITAFSRFLYSRR